MSLISILVFAVACLAFLSSGLALLGSSKTDRVRMIWYFCAMTFGAIWSIVIAVFLGLQPGSEDIAPAVIGAIYIAGALMVFCFLCYGCWDMVIGKIIFAVSMIYLVVMCVIVIQNPQLMFDSFTIDPRGNTVQLVSGWCYWSYAAIFAVNFGAAIYSIWSHARRTRSKRVRQGDYVLMAGWSVAGLIAGAFDVILPMTRYDLIWVGPLAFGILAVAFYYVFLRFRIVSISSSWMKVASSIVLTMCGVMVYMLIFYLIFTALFKIPNPSTSVLVLNFIMIVIVMLLMPVIREISASVNSLISVGQVDIAYVVKKLNHLATRNVDLRDLAGFLADHLHFAYIGFIINGRVYGSKSLAISPAELSGITHLKSTGRGEIWQEPNKVVQNTFDELGLYAVAELRNAKGKVFGQIIVGKPMGKSSFERRDLLQLEMIINLVATVIDSEKHLRA